MLVSVLNAYHLVLDDSVTDRGLEEEEEEGGGRGGSERERREEAVIQLKSLPTLVSQSLNLHIVM